VRVLAEVARGGGEAQGLAQFNGAGNLDSVGGVYWGDGRQTLIQKQEKDTERREGTGAWVP